MKNNIRQVGILGLLFACVLQWFISCDSNKKIEYYADESNYISTSGTVGHVQYSDDMTELYIGLTEVPAGFHDINFRIIGKNLSIVQSHEIDKKMTNGAEISFIAAPLYFGDGYVVPLVSLAVGGEVLLSFDDGFTNLQEWLMGK